MLRSEEIASRAHIIVSGDAFYGGFQLYGPFENREAATKWRDEKLVEVSCDSTYILPLIEPWK